MQTVSAIEAPQKSKRQRHVFPTNEIPHIWFHKTQSDARNAQGNLYFENETIYSYGSHFPIARHVKNKSGKKSAILFTTRSYSSTTSGHISAVRSSIPHGVTVFHVYDPSLTSNSMSLHVPQYLKDIELTAKSAFERKTETTRNEDVNSAKSLIAECRAFCAFFGLKVPNFSKLPKIDADKLARQAQAIKDRQHAKDEAQRARWEAESAQHKAEADQWNASGICTHTPKHDAHNYGDVHTCDRMREEEEWLAKSADIIERWRQGDPSAVLRNPWNLPVMLRIRTFNADESAQYAVAQVETSRGARIPVSHAIRGLRFVRSVVQRHEAFQTNGHTFHLGNYKIDRIDVDGTLTADCHVISYAEIESIAGQLEAIAAIAATAATLDV